MKRTNISKRIEAERVVVEFDEVYDAGSRVTVTSHFSEEFTAGATGVTYRIVISDFEAPGIWVSSTASSAAPKWEMPF